MLGERSIQHICSSQKLGSESQGQFVFKWPAVTHMTLK